MPHTAVVVFAVVGALSSLFACSVGLAALVLTVGRLLRRGGTPKPPALRAVSPVGEYTTNGTGISVAFTSSRSAPGYPSEEKATQLLRVLPSRPTALGFSGSAASAGRSPGQPLGLAG